ncbi:Sideroflexin-2 [Chamberlinius hualienensis]
MEKRLNLDQALWDQSTFHGRLKHFFWVTDPRSVVVRDAELDQAKELVHRYKNHNEPPGTTNEQVLYAKKLYEAAFHPDSGERMNILGRMSFQVPGGMVITGFMLQFYRTVPQVIFWQWVNQSFNALVNYTNRNAESDVTATRIGVAYVSATTSALVTALGLKRYLEKRATPLLQRFVPFAAVAAANCVNIPLMRQSELTDGIAVFSHEGERLTESRLAAAKGITQVVISRIVMAAPGMLILPLIMEKIEKYRWMQRIQPLHALVQTVLVGGFLIFMTPTACALFPQKCSIKVSTLEKWEKEKYLKLVQTCQGKIPERVYFNKGL